MAQLRPARPGPARVPIHESRDLLTQSPGHMRKSYPFDLVHAAPKRESTPAVLMMDGTAQNTCKLIGYRPYASGTGPGRFSDVRLVVANLAQAGRTGPILLT